MHLLDIETSSAKGEIVTLSSKTRTISDPFLLWKPAHSPTPFPPLLPLQKIFCHHYKHQEPPQPHLLTLTLFPFPLYSPALPVLFIYVPKDFKATPITQKANGLPLSLPSTCQHFHWFFFLIQFVSFEMEPKIGFSFSLHCRTLTYPLSKQHSLSFPSEATLPYVYLTANKNPLFIFLASLS